MRALLFLTLALMFTCGLCKAHAAVECECPSIAARGKGNSSCSASESNNKCTIDFNAFREREERARNVLDDIWRRSHSGQTLAFPKNDQSTIAALANANGPRELPSAVSLYLLVALIDHNFSQLGSERKIVEGRAARDIQDIAELVNRIDPNLLRRFFGGESIEMFKSFDPEKLLNRPQDLVSIPTETFRYENVSGTLMPGCIEVTTRSGVWVMFKMSTSPVRSFPRCGK